MFVAYSTNENPFEEACIIIHLSITKNYFLTLWVQMYLKPQDVASTSAYERENSPSSSLNVIIVFPWQKITFKLVL